MISVRDLARRTDLGQLAYPFATFAVAALLASCAASPQARADADPASDVLLTQTAFFPYEPAVSEHVEESLTTTLEQAAAAGLPLRVAVINTPEDLGAVPRFFDHPQAYARFLDHEISYRPLTPLLVVMPAGLGVAGVPRPNSLAQVYVDRFHSSYGLVVTAIAAVHELLRERGHKLATSTPVSRNPTPRANRRSSRSRGPSALLFALPVALFGLAGLAVHLRVRKRAAG